jgi:phenylpyruvate tautomerase PptA (4-oxalocrotonate tautomerase family)
MPTYICKVPHDSLTQKQKVEIAQAISRRHSEATGAPKFFVQVEIEDSPTTSRFLGGEPAGSHIWIRGDIRAGREESVRRQLMLNIMKDVSDICGIGEEHVWIYLCNLEPTDMVEYGKVLPKPGGESEWFAALPVDLQRYLQAIGTTEKNFKL